MLVMLVFRFLSCSPRSFTHLTTAPQPHEACTLTCCAVVLVPLTPDWRCVGEKCMLRWRCSCSCLCLLMCTVWFCCLVLFHRSCYYYQPNTYTMSNQSFLQIYESRCKLCLNCKAVDISRLKDKNHMLNLLSLSSGVPVSIVYLLLF